MTASIRKLVAGVAAMTEMDPVIPFAAALGGSANLPVELVHVFDLTDPFVQEYLRNSIYPGDPLEKYCEGLQARLEGQVGSLAGIGEVHCRAVAGSPAQILRDAAGQPENLLLVGPTHRRRAAAALLGTTAQRVLHGTGSPVLVLRSEIPVQPRVLFAIELASDSAAEVVERGTSILDQLGRSTPAGTRFVAVVKVEVELGLGVSNLDPPGSGFDVGVPLSDLQQQVAEAAATRLESFVEGLSIPGEHENRVRVGSPAHEIVEDAKEWGADLIVVGTHARSGIARAVLGSVAESVVRDAPCSVLVIPPAIRDQD